MKLDLRFCSLLLCGATLECWLGGATANAVSPQACAIFAERIAPRASILAPLGAGFPHLPQVVQQKLYVGCLPSHGTSSARSAGADGRHFVAFDLGAQPVPTEISPAGEIAGYYFDNNNLIHSFLRTRDGAITTFDPPGAACSTQTQNTCSAAAGLAPNGTIAGTWADPSATFHGYFRASNGAFSVFDAPGAVLTGINAINPEETAAGGYFAASGGSSDFLRSRSGAFASFAVPGSTGGAPAAINPAGTITGNYYVAGSVNSHGFVRDRGGTITTFDPAGSVSTSPAAINPNGAVTGYFQPAPGGPSAHGFLRAPDGTVTTFDAPGVNLDTIPTGITPSGAIVGYNLLADFSAQHGFVRAPNGTFATFDPPGSVITNPTAVSANGEIAGWYVDANFVFHGFVGVP
jgi:hypothetical protein